MVWQDPAEQSDYQDQEMAEMVRQVRMERRRLPSVESRAEVECAHSALQLNFVSLKVSAPKLTYQVNRWVVFR